jgi:hypothetical protein
MSWQPGAWSKNSKGYVMATQEVGTATCPICKTTNAILKTNARGKHQINCDVCMSLCQTQSRHGDALMQTFKITPADEATRGATPDKTGKAKPDELATLKEKPGVVASVVRRKTSLLDDLLGVGGDK